MAFTGQDAPRKLAALREQGIVPVRPEVTAALATTAVVGGLFGIGTGVGALLQEWERAFIADVTGIDEAALYRMSFLLASPALIALLVSLFATLLQTRFFFRTAFFKQTLLERTTFWPLPSYISFLLLCGGAFVGLLSMSTYWKALWAILYAPQDLFVILTEVWGGTARALGVFLSAAALSLWIRQRILLLVIQPDEG